MAPIDIPALVVQSASGATARLAWLTARVAAEIRAWWDEDVAG